MPGCCISAQGAVCVCMCVCVLCERVSECVSECECVDENRSLLVPISQSLAESLRLCHSLDGPSWASKVTPVEFVTSNQTTKLPKTTRFSPFTFLSISWLQFYFALSCLGCHPRFFSRIVVNRSRSPWARIHRLTVSLNSSWSWSSSVLSPLSLHLSLFLP